MDRRAAAEVLRASLVGDLPACSREPAPALAGLAASARNSAPGPDGAPLAAWASAGPRAWDIVHRAYAGLIHTATWNYKENSVDVACVDKLQAKRCALALALPRTPGQSTNALAIAPIKQLANDILLDSSRGGVKGRKLEECFLPR